MEGETLEAVSFEEKIQEKVSAMAVERNTLVPKCEELALKVHYNTGMAKDAKCLCPRVSELKEVSETYASNVGAKRRTADMKVVAERTFIEGVGYTIRIEQLKGDLLDLTTSWIFRSAVIALWTRGFPCQVMKVTR